jgi:coproporphyrinogen III oxidase-like Fe-S oxidoreductase
MKPQLGFGYMAKSQVDGMITTNVTDINDYINAAGDPEKVITSIEPITKSRLDASMILNNLFNLDTFDLTSPIQK